MAAEPPQQGRLLPGECFFCEEPSGQLRWTCPRHRPFEAYALTRAEGVLGSWPGRSAFGSRSWAESVMAWNASAEGQACRADADAYWPRGLSEREQVRLKAMALLLTARIAEQGFASGSLPSVESLRLSAVERDQVIADEIERVRAQCARRRARFTVETWDAAGATYRIKERFAKKSQHFRLTVSDLGVSAVEETST